MKYLLVILTGWVALLRLDAQSPAEQANLFQRWRQQRMAELKAEEGWLNLAGRFILSDGDGTFGADKSCKYRFPEGKSAAQAGVVRLIRDSVWVLPAANTKLVWQGKPLKGPALIFPADASARLEYGSLRAFVIRRGQQLILRLRDLEHPALAAFGGVSTFPFDSSWRLHARLEPTPGRTIPITNVLGQRSEMPSPGTLVFERNGQTFLLDAVEEEGQLFLIFGDATNGESTYGSGRFLYAEMPDAQGFTWLDFNYAINPPCAFTPFATCPLPPARNVLPVPVLAGEKVFH
jgi:uncharacterized protein